MTILQLISSEGYYGAENMLITLSKSLSRLGCKLCVGVFRDSRSPHIEVAEIASREGLPACTVPCMGRWDWSTVSALEALIEDSGIDVLHTHGYKADVYGMAGCSHSRTALVSTCHNWPSRQRIMRVYAAIDRWTLKRFDRVATPSPEVAKTLRNSGIDEAKISEIGNGVDVDRFSEAAPTLGRESAFQGKRVVGFVGRLVPGKGGADLLRAAQIVLGEHPETMFALVGEGPCRGEWEALANSLGIAEHVVFTGARNDMPGVYASFDMLVLPSYAEAMPMCLLEAMAAGKPVISTSVGAVPSLLFPGLGFLVKPGDITGLSDAIIRLLRDPELGSQLGRLGREHVSRHFSARAMAQRYLQLYEQALAERPTHYAARAARQN